MIDRIAKAPAIPALVVVPLQNKYTKIRLRIQLVDQPCMQYPGRPFIHHLHGHLIRYLCRPAFSGFPPASQTDQPGSPVIQYFGIKRKRARHRFQFFKWRLLRRQLSLLHCQANVIIEACIGFANLYFSPFLLSPSAPSALTRRRFDGAGSGRCQLSCGNLRPFCCTKLPALPAAQTLPAGAAAAIASGPFRKGRDRFYFAASRTLFLVFCHMHSLRSLLARANEKKSAQQCILILVLWWSYFVQPSKLLGRHAFRLAKGRNEMAGIPITGQNRNLLDRFPFAAAH